MSTQEQIEYLGRQVLDVSSRLAKVIGVLETFHKKIEAGDAQVSKLAEWVKEASEISLSASQSVAEIRKEIAEDSAEFAKLAELMEGLIEREIDLSARLERVEKRLEG